MLSVKVCAGTNCSYKGSLEILDYLEQDENLKDKITIKSCNCFDKACKPNNAPVVKVGDELLVKATLDKVLLKIGEKSS